MDMKDNGVITIRRMAREVRRAVYQNTESDVSEYGQQRIRTWRMEYYNILIPYTSRIKAKAR